MGDNPKQTTRTAIRVVGLALLLAVGGLNLAATPPERINVQGVLRDNAGNPLGGVVPMIFGVWDDEGGGCPASQGNLLLFDEQNVTVSNGLFNAALGAGTVITGTSSSMGEAFRDNAEVWIEFVVTDPTFEILCPRVRVESAAYAQNAGGLTTLDDVAIGTTTPSARLDVAGTTELNGAVTVTGANSLDVGGAVTFSDNLTVTGVVESTTGGFRFPDATVQTTSATQAVSCPEGQCLSAIGADGVPTCSPCTEGSVGMCPPDTVRIAAWCVDMLRRSPQNFLTAISDCDEDSRMICPVEALMACDVLEPATSACAFETDTVSSRLWTSNVDAAFDDRVFQAIVLYGGDEIMRSANAGEVHPYFCCAHH